MNNNRYDTVIRPHFSSEKEAMEYYADREKFYKENNIERRIVESQDSDEMKSYIKEAFEHLYSLSKDTNLEVAQQAKKIIE